MGHPLRASLLSPLRFPHWVIAPLDSSRRAPLPAVSTLFLAWPRPLPTQRRTCRALSAGAGSMAARPRWRSMAP